MALIIWQNIAGWVSKDVFQAILWTILSILLAASTYVILRRRILSSVAPKKRARLLGLSVLVVLLFILVQIWTGVLFVLAGKPGGLAAVLLGKSLWTLGVAAAVYILVTAARHAVARSEATIEVRHKVRMASAWIGTIVFVIAAGFIWVSGIQDFGLFLGIVGAGLALSLQETLVCIAGWVLLVVRRPHFDDPLAVA